MGHAAERRRGRLARLLLPALAAGLLVSCSPGGDAPPAANTPWFGGYVEATAYPYFEFADASAGGATTLLGFVVADPEDACSPSWGGYFTLDRAASDLRLDAQIADIRRGGGEVLVSFGGAAEDELSTACTDPTALAAAYREVIDRYDLDVLDLDIELNDLEDAGANRRRAAVVAELQAERPAEDPLGVWLTLPVGSTGLGEQSLSLISGMLDAGVDLTGVNIMTMNFGDGTPRERSMLAVSTTAADTAHAQLRDAYARAGQPLSDELVWNRMGLTPMLGVNDVDGELLTVADAERLNAFARERGIGRMSYWSVNRDRPCGPEVSADDGAVGTCSGTDQRAGDFARVLGEGFGG